MAEAALWLGIAMLVAGVPLFVVTAFIQVGGGRSRSESTGRRLAVLLIITGILLWSGGCMAGGGEAWRS